MQVCKNIVTYCNVFLAVGAAVLPTDILQFFNLKLYSKKTAIHQPNCNNLNVAIRFSNINARDSLHLIMGTDFMLLSTYYLIMYLKKSECKYVS